MDFKLENKTALVTGASGGIGSAIAVVLASAEAKVYVHYNKNSQKADEVVSEIESNGGMAVAISGDITDSKSRDSIISQIIDESENLHILVNNAGVNQEGLFIRQKDADMDFVFGTNLFGLMNLTRLAVKHMMKNRYGRIINISSPAATAGSPAQTLYSASKAALHGLSKSLALELGSRNITSNVVIPGIINTKMLDDITDERREFFISRIPMGRFGEPEEVAYAVRFLASDEARYISGCELTVTGGGAVF
ncbi:3-oxoacyl-ACP reductase FabG [bacterium]|nr:3-oxoacyl-ACP reductase FabG [bacterium]